MWKFPHMRMMSLRSLPLTPQLLQCIAMAVSAIGHDLEERGLFIKIGKSSAMFIASSSTN